MYPKKVEVIRDLEPVVDGMVRRACFAFRGGGGLASIVWYWMYSPIDSYYTHTNS